MQNRYQLKNIPDAALIKNIETLSLRENEATLEILLWLTELEERKLHLSLGFSSLFAYCREKLKYSEGAANRRIKAARCIRDFPRVYQLLKERRVSLSTVCIFSAVLTNANEDELLAKVAGLGQAEVEKLVASYREPTERARDVVRVVGKSAALAVIPVEGFSAPGSSPLFGGAPSPCVVKALNPVAEAVPVASSVKLLESRSEASFQEAKSCEITKRYSFSAGEQFDEALTKMRALLSNRHPRGAALEELFLEAMSFYLKAHEPRVKKKQVGGAKEESKGAKKGRDNQEAVLAESKSAPKAPSRHIPVAVKALVYKRDGGCCSFVGADGRRCGSTWGLQFDHIMPFALGGGGGEGNVRLLCKGHNSYQAEMVYGRGYVESKVFQSRQRSDAAAAVKEPEGFVSW